MTASERTQVSKWGRAQDAVYDILFGFEAPDNRGLVSWHPGPLNDYPTEKRGELVERIITAVASTFGEDEPIIELTTREREFVIWTLGYVEGAALEMQDDATGQQANAIVEKLKQWPDA